LSRRGFRALFWFGHACTKLIEYGLSFASSSKLDVSIEIEHIDALISVVFERLKKDDGIRAIV
jgi:hypothetical protein